MKEQDEITTSHVASTLLVSDIIGLEFFILNGLGDLMLMSVIERHG